MPSQIFLWWKHSSSRASMGNLMGFHIFKLVSRLLKLAGNDWKLSVLDISPFSNTFFGLKMKFWVGVQQGQSYLMGEGAS